MSTTDRGGERGVVRYGSHCGPSTNEYDVYVLASDYDALAAERDRLRDMLEEVEVYLEDHEDVVDGDYGEPAANKAMRLLREVRAALSGGRHE